MDRRPSDDLSFDRSSIIDGSGEGYELWFDIPPRGGDATTAELQTLCRGSILVGWIAQRMGWDWTTLCRNIDHLSAPIDGFLVLEIGSTLLESDRFRQALHDGVQSCGLDANKIRIIDVDTADAYVLAGGLPSSLADRRDR